MFPVSAGDFVEVERRAILDGCVPPLEARRHFPNGWYSLTHAQRLRIAELWLNRGVKLGKHGHRGRR